MLDTSATIGIVSAAFAALSAAVAAWQGKSARDARIAADRQVTQAERAGAAAELQNELTREALREAREERMHRKAENDRAVIGEFVECSCSAAYAGKFCIKYITEQNATAARRQLGKYVKATTESHQLLPRLLPVAQDFPFLADIRKMFTRMPTGDFNGLIGRLEREGEIPQDDRDLVQATRMADDYQSAAERLRDNMYAWLSESLRAKWAADDRRRVGAAEGRSKEVGAPAAEREAPPPPATPQAAP